MRRSAVLVMVVLGLLVGCSGGGSGAGPAPDGYAVVVTRNGQELARLDLAALQALPQTSVETPGTGGGGVQEGPTVAAALDAAGVAEPVDATITGDEGTVAFTAAELDGAVLDFTNRDTVKLAGSGLPRERWIRNVTAIGVP